MGNEGRKGTLAALGAVAVAVVSSACCWLPLLLLLFGFSGGVAAARFEAWRPVLLPVTFVLLALGWYFTLRPAVSGAARATDGADCCPPRRQRGFSLRTFNLGLLAVATVMTLAFAFFPNYVGVLVPPENPMPATGHDVVLGIEGMTCAGCEVNLSKRLAAVDGVAVSDVDYESGQAVVRVADDLDEDLLRQAVENAGYQVTDIQSRQGAAP